MNSENNRLLQVQNWVMRHFKDWETICGLNGAIDLQEYNRLRQLIIESGFEELYFVLFTIHFYAIRDYI